MNLKVSSKLFRRDSTIHMLTGGIKGGDYQIDTLYGKHYLKF